MVRSMLDSTEFRAERGNDCVYGVWVDEKIMKKTLTRVQANVLSRMTPTKWYCAYELQATMATLDSLVAKGFVTERRGLGAFLTPRVSIEFCRVDKGSGCDELRVN